MRERRRQLISEAGFRAGRAPRRERGVVMVVTLLALFLLAALVFWVINLGQQVNDRVASQHAADAAAAGGAGWLARSLNTIAANNTQMARLIAAVAVMDAMDEAVNHSLTEQQVLRERLGEHLAGGSLSGNEKLNHVLHRLLNETATEMDEHIEQLASTAAAMQRSGVAAAASYQDNGRLWQAIEAADDLNASIVQQLDATVRSAAETGGRANMADVAATEDAGVTLLPLELRVPVRRGAFNDFQRPVRDGLLPEDEDHRVHARGPWDTLLGWRDPVGRWIEGTQIEGNSRVAHVSATTQKVPVTRAVVEDARAVDAQFQPHAYRTYGPLEWMLRQVRQYAVQELGSTRLDWYVQRLTDVKIERVWPRPDPTEDQRNAGLMHADASPGIGRYRVWGEHRPVVEPDWITDLEQAMELAYRDPDQIKETAFFVVEIKSRFPPSHDRFMEAGTWAEVRDAHMGERRLVIRPGWEDPMQWQDAPLVREWAWEDVWQYHVFYDREVGVPPQRDGEGNLVGQPVFRVDHVVFAGVNVGEEAGIRDPFAGLGRDAPAPMRLDAQLVSHDDATERRRHLSVLGVVRRPSRAAVWRERFVGGGPTGDMLAIAQARVFNHHSWDLWTQSWQAELEAVTAFDEWVAGMRGLTADHESQQVYQHLQALEPLAPVILSH